MRVVVALVLVAAGSLFTYWIFLETMVSAAGPRLEWALLTAFGWLVCHDLWQRFSGRGERGRGRERGPLV
jgi:hypothetical protein